jgi:hypothetical protein
VGQAPKDDLRSRRDSAGSRGTSADGVTAVQFGCLASCTVGIALGISAAHEAGAASLLNRVPYVTLGLVVGVCAWAAIVLAARSARRWRAGRPRR